MDGDSVKTLSAKVSPSSPPSQTTNETEDRDELSNICPSIGCFLLMVTASAWLWGFATHTAYIAIQKGCNPVLLAWLCTVAYTVAPVLCRIRILGRAEQAGSWRVLGLQSVTPALIIKRIFPVCSFSLLALSLYLLALHSLHSSEAVVLYSCNKAFCYLLTWTILREPFLGARVVALVFCMAGVVMMSYRESPDEEASSGRILALSAAAVTAINEVVTRLLIGKPSCQETVVFLGLCGLCSSFVLWWAPLIVLLHQGMEELELLIFPDIKYLCASVFFFFLYEILEKIGSHFAPSSGVSLGVFLSTAVVSGMEQQWEVPPGMNMMGYCSIGVGFFLLLIPEVFWTHLGFTHQEQAYQEEFNEEIKNKCTVSIM